MSTHLSAHCLQLRHFYQTLVWTEYSEPKGTYSCVHPCWAEQVSNCSFDYCACYPQRIFTSPYCIPPLSKTVLKPWKPNTLITQHYPPCANSSSSSSSSFPAFRDRQSSYSSAGPDVKTRDFMSCGMTMPKICSVLCSFQYCLAKSPMLCIRPGIRWGCESRFFF